MPVRAIITRPTQQAQAWLQNLQAASIDAQLLPLIDIGPVQNDPVSNRLWQNWQQFDACMFVSSNAVYHFLPGQLNALKSIKVPANNDMSAINLIAIKSNYITRYWATGAGTVAALQDCGVELQQIDAPAGDAAHWDSEHLWMKVQQQVTAGKRVLILRGQDVGTPLASRDWLAQKIRSRGATVEIAMVYQRSPPVWSVEQQAMAERAAADDSIWVFSSSQAIAHLQLLLPKQRWDAAKCIATHPRIAQAAVVAGFGVVCMSRPGIQEVAISLKSLHV